VIEAKQLTLYTILLTSQFVIRCVRTTYAPVVTTVLISQTVYITDNKLQHR